MAKDREIQINGDIGGYSYSMGYVRYLMKELGEGPISVKVTSYGGDVNHALKIKNLFQEHGDVTVEYIGFNASAATIIGHGAKKTLIHEDALYLIHKPSVWVDTWGYMNEDELAQAIIDVQAQKKDAETVTLVLAQDYVNSRGIELKKVMELMKEARWLSAKETVEMGLVDELVSSKGKKPVVTNQAIAIMSAAGLPVPEIENEAESSSVHTTIREEINKGFQEIKNKFFNNSTIKMDKQYSFVNQALGVEGVEVKDGKVTLTVEQILAFNNKLKESDEAVTNAAAAKETAETAKKTAEDSLSDVLNKLDEIDPTVKAAADTAAKVTAIRAKLAERPGVKEETPQGDASKNDLKNDGSNWDVINTLPHNKVLDESFDASFS
jgi:ATP-dependent protease ClpP protease subunit